MDYLAQRHRLGPEQVFFAGDSGNDLDALASGVCGTLVGNAPSPVRAQAAAITEQTDGARLYLAGNFYGDGIIEGLKAYRFINHDTGL